MLSAVCVDIKLPLGACHPPIHWIFIFSPFRLKYILVSLRLLEQGKSNSGGSPPLPDPRLTLHTYSPPLASASSQGALPTLLPLHVCAACGAQLCLPFFCQYTGWNLIPTPAIVENVFVASPLCGGCREPWVQDCPPLFCWPSLEKQDVEMSR